jgi:hypothetical protein
MMIISILAPCRRVTSLIARLVQFFPMFCENTQPPSLQAPEGSSWKATSVRYT